MTSVSCGVLEEGSWLLIRVIRFRDVWPIYELPQLQLISYTRLAKKTLQYNQNYYHQLDGLAMGSPLAPAMADICINWLTNEVLAKIKKSTRYHALR